MSHLRRVWGPEASRVEAFAEPVAEARTDIWASTASTLNVA
jgi:hypothetical protein